MSDNENDSYLIPDVDWPTAPATEVQDGDGYREKLRTLSFGMRHQGTKRVTPVLNETTGQRVGRQIEHWSGRVDATAERVTATPNHEIFKGDAPND